MFGITSLFFFFLYGLELGVSITKFNSSNKFLKYPSGYSINIAQSLINDIKPAQVVKTGAKIKVKKK